MDPAGAVWQNELSQKVLNHPPSQEKGEVSDVTRYLHRTQCPVPVFSKQITVSASGRIVVVDPDSQPEQLLFIRFSGRITHICLLHLSVSG